MAIAKSKSVVTLGAMIDQAYQLREQRRQLAAEDKLIKADLDDLEIKIIAKLDAEGTSFQVIKDDWRRDQAMLALRQTGLSIQEVALRVGFREATVFIKAFRQWTGMTPGEYRTRLASRRRP